MKRAPALLFLACSLAGGVLAHHFSETRAPARRDGHVSSSMASHTSSPAAPPVPVDAAARARKMLAGIFSDEPLTWLELEDTRNAMQPGDYLLVLRAMERIRPNAHNFDPALTLALIDRAAETDPYGLLAFGEESPDYLWEIGGAAFRRDPAAALATIARYEAANEDHRNARNLTLELLTAALTKGGVENPAASLQALVQAGMLEMAIAPSGLKSSLVEVVASWVEKDAGAALAFAEQHPSLLGTALRECAARDIDTALAWLEAHPESAASAFGDWQAATQDPFASLIDQVPPREKLLNEYARKHPVEAARFSDEVTNGGLFRSSQVDGMGTQPVETAAAWVRSLPQEVQVKTCQELIGTLSQWGKPDDLLALCRQFPEALPAREEDAFLSLVQRRPDEFSQMLLTAPLSDSEKAISLSEAMLRWREQAPEAATAFIQNLPPGDLQGRLLMDQTQLLMDGTRDAAIEYALTLPEASRLGALRFIQDSNTASRDWIDELTDPAMREALHR